MKKCPNCGMNFGDDKLLCPNCGSTPVSVETENAFFNSNRGTGNPERKLEWYESTWFIVLSFFIFWPVAVAMIVLRCSRNNSYNSMNDVKLSGYSYSNGAGGTSSDDAMDAKFSPHSASKRVRTGSVGKLIIGIICLSIGLMIMFESVVDSEENVAGIMASSGLFIAIGLVLIIVFAVDNKDWHKYEALVDNRGNTRISFIASRLGIKESKARNKLQKMINKGFLNEPENNIGAYINGEYDLVVMTRNGRPIVPVEETMAEDIASKRAKAEAEADKARRAGAVSAEDKLLVAIEDGVNFTKDVEVIRYLKRMEKSVRSIKQQIEEAPEKADLKSVANMRNSYIPSTMELIYKYIKPDITEESRANIKGMFATLASAFSNLDKKLKKQDDIEMEAEIEVMKQTLARDGLLDSDFDI